ncbi:hypothetical protein AGMMS4957_18160 [Bacteroidia bacterium]|nr:hypothetical protein AGMMS4957_18160 [Bacteroidia bacterium]
MNQFLELLRVSFRRLRLQREIMRYLKNNAQDNEKKEILAYLKYHPLTCIPYSFKKKYKKRNVTVYTDEVYSMKYILQDGKRLYLKSGWDEKQVQNYCYSLITEQDKESPHLYETPTFHVQEGDVVVDAGVAEGNFALSVVERAKKLYLFETDEMWIEALKVTFAPWKEKVVFVHKYVADNNDDNNISLDEFFGDEKIDFIKADIEGAERLLLKGAKNILSRQTPMKAVLCTYHRDDDADTLAQMLLENGFRTEFSKGYIFFLWDRLSPPYLRRGLIRGTKQHKNENSLLRH